MEEVKEPILVPTSLDRLEAMLKRDAVVELVRVYIEEGYKTVAAIKASLDKNDIPSLRHYAHDLKGTSGNFGLMRLHIAAQSLEHAAKTEELDKIPSLANPIPDLFAEGILALKERFKGINLR